MNKEIVEWAQLCASGSGEDCRACTLPLVHTSCVELFAKAIIEQHERYRWHDLRKDPDDLPPILDSDNLIFLTCTNHYTDKVEYRDYLGKSKLFDYVNNLPIIAWREIEPYEAEEANE